MNSDEIRWLDFISVGVHELKPSGIRQFFDIVASRKDVISLGVGEPDFVSPDPVIDAAIEALRDGYTHYTGNLGRLELRRALSDYIYSEYSVYYRPEDEIIITVGVSQAVDLVFRTLLNPGDSAMYPLPGYVAYEPMIRLAGGNPVPVPTRFENNFELTREDLEKAWRPGTKALLLNYPSNPTGASYSRETLLTIADFAAQKNLIVIADEIYADIAYDSAHVSFPSLPRMKDRTILLGGFSKNFAMTGWRIGYAAGPSELLKAMNKIHQYSMLCAPTISQIAAEAALRYAIPERNRMRDAYKARRDFVVKRLHEIDLPVVEPRGAFYVFPQLKGISLTATEFATQLLDTRNVAVVPGSAFGEQYDQFFRASYATSMADLSIALDRLEEFVREIR